VQRTQNLSGLVFIKVKFMSDSPQPACLYCGRDDQQIPLLPIQYQGTTYWICPEHLPILIHKPAQLADKLPGAEKLSPTEQ
jgi:hypothetical protein